MFERFDDWARKVYKLANVEAGRLNHEYIGTEHILLGLVSLCLPPPEGQYRGGEVSAGITVLENLGLEPQKIKLEVLKLVKRGPEAVTMSKLPQTPRAKKVVEYAIEEARNLNQNYVGTEHLLLGLLREHDGVAAQVLTNLRLRLEDVREEVLRVTNPEPEKPLGGGEIVVEDIVGEDPRASAQRLRQILCDLEGIKERLEVEIDQLDPE